MQLLRSLETENLPFRASNITGTQYLDVEFGRDLSVRSVTDSIVHRMALPTDVTWTLRDDSSSVYLDDDRPIGDQLARDANVTITPRAHLGGSARPVA